MKHRREYRAGGIAGQSIAAFFVLVAAGMIAGCSSTPMSGGRHASPVTTGSVAIPVEVQQPLPPTLAYSDASKIGETAAGALSEFAANPSAEWINASTGSSGTVVASAGGESAAEPSTACKLFQTVVTSFRGVHQYSGTICAEADGRKHVRIEEPNLAPDPVPQLAEASPARPSVPLAEPAGAAISAGASTLY